jgi:hypothetical protein
MSVALPQINNKTLSKEQNAHDIEIHPQINAMLMHQSQGIIIIQSHLLIRTHRLHLFDLLLQQLLRLVNLGRKVRRAPTIRVVQQHERAVLFPEKFFGDTSFTAYHVLAYFASGLERVGKRTHGISSISAASRRVILGSKPPL